MSAFAKPAAKLPISLVRSGDLNDFATAVKAAFDLLPDETRLKNGTVMYAIVSGTADNLILTLPSAPSGYVSGLSISFIPSLANTGAITVNVNGLGVISVKNGDGGSNVANDLIPNVPYTIAYSAASSCFYLTSATYSAATKAAQAAASAVQAAASAAWVPVLTSANAGQDLIVNMAGNGFIADTGARGFRNKILNGDFQIWQGGTSFTNPTNNATAYCADQWVFWRSAFNNNITASKQQTQTASSGARIQRTVGDTALNYLSIASVHESLDVVKLAGKIVTLQLKAKCGANFSSTSNIVNISVVVGTGTDSTILAGFTGSSTVTSQNITVSTTLQQFSLSCTLPSNASQLSIWGQYTPTGTAGANDWFEITDVQLEEGSVATPFERRPYGLELSLCQRYYWRWTASGIYSSLAVGECGTNVQYCHIQFPNTMRVNPTCAHSSLGISTNGVLITPTIVYDMPCTSSVRASASGGASTSGHACRLVANNNAAAYFEASARL